MLRDMHLTDTSMDQERVEGARSSVARNAGIVSLAVMASRVLGLVRAWGALASSPEAETLCQILPYRQHHYRSGQEGQCACSLKVYKVRRLVRRAQP